jgi:hypothetical protein
MCWPGPHRSWFITPIRAARLPMRCC